MSNKSRMLQEFTPDLVGSVINCDRKLSNAKSRIAWPPREDPRDTFDHSIPGKLKSPTIVMWGRVLFLYLHISFCVAALKASRYDVGDPGGR